MNFRKVNEHELHCSVSVDEIHENGLEVSDLLKRSDKTYDFFEYLVQEGREETGFERNGPMSVEGVFVNGTLELIFRAVGEDEDDEAWEEQEASAGSAMPSFEQMDPEQEGELKLLLVQFDSAGQLYRFCRHVSFAELIPSELYLMDGQYCLIVEMDACSRAQIGSFCMLINEYAAGGMYGDLPARYVMEHGRRLCTGALQRFCDMQAES